MSWIWWVLIILVATAIVLFLINYFRPVKENDDGLSALRRAFGGGCGAKGGEELF